MVSLNNRLNKTTINQIKGGLKPPFIFLFKTMKLAYNANS